MLRSSVGGNDSPSLCPEVFAVKNLLSHWKLKAHEFRSIFSQRCCAWSAEADGYIAQQDISRQQLGLSSVFEPTQT